MSDRRYSQHSGQDFLPEIRRGRFDRLTIYEVSESELTILERGSPDSIYLNFAISLLSTAISLTVSLLTTTVASNAVFIIFVICTVIGYIGGALLLALWRRNHSSVSDCVETIRKRLPPEGIVESFSKIERGEDTLPTNELQCQVGKKFQVQAAQQRRRLRQAVEKQVGELYGITDTDLAAVDAALEGQTA